MSATVGVRTAILATEDPEKKHRRRLLWTWIISIGLMLPVTIYGLDYYLAGTMDRPLSPKHDILRPSGTVGINLGLIGMLGFIILFLYPLRKRWAWLGRQGSSRHWLDFHAALGTIAPLFILLHSSFKFRGIAGMAFWIMTAVTLSGYVGRYLYAQIPRSLSAAELSMKELVTLEDSLRKKLAEQNLRFGSRTEEMYLLPSPADVAEVSMLTALSWMIWIDCKRPFQVSLVRFQAAGFFSWLFSFCGLYQTKDRRLENAIMIARKQAVLAKRILFLSRTQQVFKLWHVVHRPFSYSFALLAFIHIGVVLYMGYR
jgi:hypothetical protein